MRLPTLTLVAALAAAAILPAQSATFAAYGSGCGGSGNACVVANWGTNLASTTGASANFALRFNTGNAARVVCGAELYCFTLAAAAVKMNVWIYDQASGGAPGKPLATTTMNVGTTAAAYKATFQKPLILTKNTNYFLVFDNRVRLRLPIMSSGTAQVHYWNGPPTWSGPWTTQRWNYRILCCGSGPAPQLSNTGLPVIGKSFSIDLSNAPSNARAMYAIGVVRTAVPLAPAGAPNCTLYTNPLAVLPLTTNGSGNASASLSVPNNNALIGFQFFNQFAIVDAGANALQLIFTNGGAAKAGT